MIGLRKIFVGGLTRDTTDETLKAYFSFYGDVYDVVIMRDQSKTWVDQNEMLALLGLFKNKLVNESTLKISFQWEENKYFNRCTFAKFLVSEENKCKNSSHDITGKHCIKKIYRHSEYPQVL
jgi:hypothetical protein